MYLIDILNTKLGKSFFEEALVANQNDSINDFSFQVVVQVYMYLHFKDRRKFLKPACELIEAICC